MYVTYICDKLHTYVHGLHSAANCMHTTMYHICAIFWHFMIVRFAIIGICRHTYILHISRRFLQWQVSQISFIGTAAGNSPFRITRNANCNNKNNIIVFNLQNPLKISDRRGILDVVSTECAIGNTKGELCTDTMSTHVNTTTISRVSHWCKSVATSN